MTLRIGFSGALEGPYAAYDATLLKGMEYAAREAPAEAGDPVTVEIVSKNNKGDQALAATTTQELIDDGDQGLHPDDGRPVRRAGLVIRRPAAS